MKYRVGNKTSHDMKCYASGGRVSNDISEKSALPKVSGPKMADGGTVDGGKAKPRLDRAGKKGTTVNITIASGKPDGGLPGAGAGPLPMPPPVPGPMAGPPPIPHSMPPVPPMGAGGPPMMRKHGGRVMKHDDEAEDKKLIKKEVKASALKHKAAGGPVAEGQDDPTEEEAEKRSVGRKDGGRVTKHHMTAGAGSGAGRLEKIGKK